MKFIRHMKLYFEQNKIEITILTLFFLIDLIYLSNTTANVPMMDYWRFGNDFLYNMFNGGIRFSDFWESVNGQRAFLTYLLFFINIHFFHWNTRVAILGGSVITYITGLVIIKIFKEYLETPNKKWNRIFYYISIFAVSMILFNYVQWEIKTIEFAAPFSVSILFVILNMHYSDELLCNLSQKSHQVFYFTIFLGISICFIFSAFFPAVVGAICICGAHNFFSNYKAEKLSYIASYIIVGTGIFVSAGIYLFDIKGIADNSNNVLTFGKYILNGDFIKGLIMYLGSSVLHVAVTERISPALVICIGCIIGLLYGFGLYYGFKNRDSERYTYFPIMLIIYTLLVGVLLSYGRGNVFDTTYMCSSRYSYQSKLGLIGSLMILSKRIALKKRHYVLKIIVPLFMLSLMTYSQFVEFKFSPYRRITFDTLIQNMYTIENKDDNDLDGFQGGNPMYIRQTVYYMKLYKLGVFHNISSIEQATSLLVE